MRKKIKQWALASAIGSSVLNGCVTTTSMGESTATDNWQLTGKIAIAYPDAQCGRERCPSRSDQGKIIWKQQANDYHITLSDPFGRLLITLDGNNKSLHAQSPGKAPIITEPQQFIALMVADSEQQSTLNTLTPQLLRHWVTGRPAPGIAVSEKDKQHFVQQGFSIHTRQWRKTPIGQMPSLITIEKEALKLRLVVRDWLINK